MAVTNLVKSERGFTLIEITVSMLLLSMLTVAAYGIIQSSSRLMSYGSKQTAVGQATRAGVEHIKGMMHRGTVPNECYSAGTGHLVLNADFEFAFSCEESQTNLSRLFKFTVYTKDRSTEEVVAEHSFYALRGGF